MKYFKIIGPTVEADAYISSPIPDDTPERLVEELGPELGPVAVLEISKEEFEEAVMICEED